MLAPGPCQLRRFGHQDKERSYPTPIRRRNNNNNNTARRFLPEDLLSI